MNETNESFARGFGDLLAFIFVPIFPSSPPFSCNFAFFSRA